MLIQWFLVQRRKRYVTIMLAAGTIDQKFQLMRLHTYLTIERYSVACIGGIDRLSLLFIQ